MILTCAHKRSRVRTPPPICSTNCCHILSWVKPWVTSEHNLSSLSCVLIFSTNRTICWDSGITTVGWRKYHTSQTQQWKIANISISTGDSRTSCHWGELEPRIIKPRCSDHWDQPSHSSVCTALVIVNVSIAYQAAAAHYMPSDFHCELTIYISISSRGASAFSHSKCFSSG